MIKLALNLRVPNNYAFFCPVSRMHLTVSSPVGFSSEVTPAILKGLKTKTLIDIDNVIDLETGTVIVNAPIEASKKTEKPEKVEEPATNEVAKKTEEPEQVQESIQESVADESTEAAEEKKVSTKKTTKKTKTE